ncbi:MAG: transglutaminase family protein [Actinomycetota bacterium]
MRLSITHTTTYRYDEPVIYGLHELRLIPRSGPTQDVEWWDTQTAAGTRQVRFTDHHRNIVELVRAEPGATETIVVATGDVVTADTAGVVGPEHGHTPGWLYRRDTELTAPGPNVRRLARAADRDAADLDVLHGLSALVREAVDYIPGTTEVDSTAEAVVESASGVCQDHAHVFVTAARMLGYAARYVSGYLFVAGGQEDASHAWAEVSVEGLGWVGFDIANQISPDERYVRLAVGLDYRDAAPISGVRRGTGGETLEVDVSVTEQGSAQQ